MSRTEEAWGEVVIGMLTLLQELVSAANGGDEQQRDEVRARVTKALGLPPDGREDKQAAAEALGGLAEALRADLMGLLSDDAERRAEARASLTALEDRLRPGREIKLQVALEKLELMTSPGAPGTPEGFAGWLREVADLMEEGTPQAGERIDGIIDELESSLGLLLPSTEEPEAQRKARLAEDAKASIDARMSGFSLRRRR